MGLDHRISILSGIALYAAAIFNAQAADDDSVSRGEYLARAANCVACHSLPGGQAFAGGLKMATPVGAIYATNITPDPETGIGAYTLEEFSLAVREGVAKDGHRLYPAMPYPSYTKISDEDIAALYEYFMNEVPAVQQENKPSEIPWPLNMRWPLAIWNMLFFDSGVYESDPEQSEAWNRGAYLVQGLGHCGACHTPRGLAFNEQGYDEGDELYLAGAFLDNWYASNLTQDPNTGLGRWSESDIATFMKTGRNQHSTAFGTMDEVIINSTQYLSDDDLNGMAAYLASLPGAHEAGEAVWTYDPATEESLRSRRRDIPGAVLYVQNCESCHGSNGGGFPPYMPPLAGNPPVLDDDPASLINLTLNGSSRLIVDGTPDAYRMPGFRVTLTNQEIADILTFMRNAWGNDAPAVTAEQVEHFRTISFPAEDRMPVLRMK